MNRGLRTLEEWNEDARNGEVEEPILMHGVPNTGIGCNVCLAHVSDTGITRVVRGVWYMMIRCSTCEWTSYRIRVS